MCRVILHQIFNPSLTFLTLFYSISARAVTHPVQVLSILDDEQKEKPYDLVLADVHMPVMNGIELLDRITKKFNIPVVRKFLYSHEL